MKHKNLIGAIALITLVLFLGLSPVYAGDQLLMGEGSGLDVEVAGPQAGQPAV